MAKVLPKSGVKVCDFRDIHESFDFDRYFLLIFFSPNQIFQTQVNMDANFANPEGERVMG